MEYKCETSDYSNEVRRRGDAYAVRFTNNLRFRGSDSRGKMEQTDGVSITLVDNAGADISTSAYTVTISVKDFLAVARALKG